MSDNDMDSLRKVILFDPAVSSLNLGDHIISESARQHLKGVLEDAFVVDISTHLPVSRYLRFVRDANMRFVLGSNLLRGKMNRSFRQWDLNPLVAHLVAPVVLMGVGWWQYGDDPNGYTKMLYRKILHSETLHSVRDTYTAERLSSIGIKNVLMTGCPSMWSLTPEHCEGIPLERGRRVVVTLTGYHPDLARDRMMLKTLCKTYESVSVWIQGYRDFDYFRELGQFPEVDLIGPNLTSFDLVLQGGDVDYVGTRLHGGIRALQHGRRSLVIGIDNRALEKQRDFGLPCLRRQDIGDLRSVLEDPRPISIRLPLDDIARWKAQFPAESSSVRAPTSPRRAR